MQEDISKAYADWAVAQTPTNMAKVLKALKPLLIGEINRYPGDNHILRGHAKKLAVNAVKTYNPTSGAKLTSWVVTQMQPLSRIGRKSQQLLNTSELSYRQFAQLNDIAKEFKDEEGREPTDEELADAAGISVKRIAQVRKMNPVVRSVGQLEDVGGGGDDAMDFSMPAVEDLGADPALNTAVEAVYDSADERDRVILEHKMGRGGKELLSNQDIAKRLGVSPGLVSQRSLNLAKNIQDAYGI